MKSYTKICPICGTVNKDLYLEETDGWMECEKCKISVKVEEFGRMVRVPVYSIYSFSKELKKAAGAEAAN